jgi:hypothetical protein
MDRKTPGRKSNFSMTRQGRTQEIRAAKDGSIGDDTESITWHYLWTMHFELVFGVLQRHPRRVD